jgi:hypothetical protein
MGLVYRIPERGLEIELRSPQLTAAVVAALQLALADAGVVEPAPPKRGPGRPPKVSPTEGGDEAAAGSTN